MSNPIYFTSLEEVILPIINSSYSRGCRVSCVAGAPLVGFVFSAAMMSSRHAYDAASVPEFGEEVWHKWVNAG